LEVINERNLLGDEVQVKKNELLRAINKSYQDKAVGGKEFFSRKELKVSSIVTSTKTRAAPGRISFILP
jgi:hypothetical protein